MSWTEDLVVGDAVIVQPHLGEPWLTVVARATKTMVMVRNNRSAEFRFWRANGRLVGSSDWVTAWLSPTTDEHARARVRKATADRWRQWIAKNIGKVPDDQVMSLVWAMKETIPEGDS